MYAHFFFFYYLSHDLIFFQVGVLGAGQMGTGIAKVLVTTAKLPVILVDSKTEASLKAQTTIRMFS